MNPDSFNCTLPEPQRGPDYSWSSAWWQQLIWSCKGILLWGTLWKGRHKSLGEALQLTKATRTTHPTGISLHARDTQTCLSCRLLFRGKSKEKKAHIWSYICTLTGKTAFNCYQNQAKPRNCIQLIICWIIWSQLINIVAKNAHCFLTDFFFSGGGGSGLYNSFQAKQPSPAMPRKAASLALALRLTHPCYLRSYLRKKHSAWVSESKKLSKPELVRRNMGLFTKIPFIQAERWGMGNTRKVIPAQAAWHSCP